MPRSSRMRSAVGVVGSFAPSATTFPANVFAFASFVMTPPSAAGTSQSQGIVHSSSFVTRCGNRPQLVVRDALALRPLADPLSSRHVRDQRRDVDALVIVDAAVDVAHRDDRGPGLAMEQPREMAADVAEALYHDAPALERDAEVAGVLLHHVHDAAAGRLLAAQ